MKSERIRTVVAVAPLLALAVLGLAVTTVVTHASAAAPAMQGSGYSFPGQAQTEQGNDAYFASGGGGSEVVRRSGPAQTSEVDLSDVHPSFVGEEEGDWTAYSVSPAGDVNGDGFGDIVVGAPWAGHKQHNDPMSGEGRVYLILGRPQYQWPADPMNLAQADASFLGCEPGLMTGRQNYTAGDVNGDGYDDFLISGWKCGPEKAGKTYLILGRPNVDWGADFPVEGADASFIGENDGDKAGYYVSTAGDVNGDGNDDFLITSPQNADAGYKAGQVYLILGRSLADWGSDSSLSHPDASFLGENEDDRAGRSAAGVGDVNNDGYDDFVIGAIFSGEAGEHAGQSYLILGRPEADWGQDYSLSLADASFLGEAAGDELGRRVAGAGDINGDGLADILLAASRQDEAGEDAGKVYLILGRPEADWGMDFPLAMADATFLGENAFDQAGRRVSSAGDFDGNGCDDFLIGAPHSNRGGEAAGAAYLILGRPAADWGTGYPLSQADVIYIGEPDVGRAGYDVAPADDMDGDGMDDFLIGAYGGRQTWEITGTAYAILSQVGVGPGMPILVSPPDGVVTYTSAITLVWDAGGGGEPEAYNLEVDGMVMTTTRTTSGTLLTAGVHTWRVRAFNDAGYSAYSAAWTLEIIDLPGVPVLLAPEDGSITSAHDVALTWEAGSGGVPDGYNLELDGEVMTTTGTLWLGTLESGPHVWRVRSFNAAGYSAYSNPWTLEIVDPPGVPALLAPEDGAITSAHDVALTWEAGPGGVPDGYNLELDGEVMTTTGTQWLGALESGTHVWRVRSFNAAGYSAYSNPWALEIVDPPGVPALLAPEDGAITSAHDVALTWEAGPGGVPDGYNLELDGEVMTTTGTLWLGTLESGPHVWRVRSFNAAGYSAYSDAWTLNIVDPPGVPTPLAPANGAITTTPTITFTWEVGPGGVPDGYNLELNGVVIVTYVPVYYAVVDIGEYGWRVRSFNLAGYSDYTAAWTLVVGEPTHYAYLPLIGRNH